jgi:hypothetical protein
MNYQFKNVAFETRKERKICNHRMCEIIERDAIKRVGGGGGTSIKEF